MSYKEKILQRLTAAVTLRQAQHASEKTLLGIGAIGEGSVIGVDAEIYSPECITIGAGVRIGRRARLQAVTQHNHQTFSPAIVLSDGVSIENNVTITANSRVEIRDHAMVAGNVFISDHEHGYQDPDQPVQVQDLSVGSGVVIGAGAHIGQNVSIFGDVTIGEHSVVGANSVVTKDVPAYSIVVGAPARVVRQYNKTKGAWVKAK